MFWKVGGGLKTDGGGGGGGGGGHTHTKFLIELG